MNTQEALEKFLLMVSKDLSDKMETFHFHMAETVKDETRAFLQKEPSSKDLILPTYSTYLKITNQFLKLHLAYMKNLFQKASEEERK